MFTVLFNEWNHNPETWSRNFNKINAVHLAPLAIGFSHWEQRLWSLEKARDSVRLELHTKFPILFPNGSKGTNVSCLAKEILRSQTFISRAKISCSHCNFMLPSMDNSLGHFLPVHSVLTSCTAEMLSEALCNSNIGSCSDCGGDLAQTISYDTLPKLMAFELHDKMIASKKIKIVRHHKAHILHLRGLIYFGGFHYTARIISPEGLVYFHDGMKTGGHCIAEKDLQLFSEAELKVCEGRLAELAIYSVK